jgi:glycyl-tRNA synthetase (class II)
MSQFQLNETIKKLGIKNPVRLEGNLSFQPDFPYPLRAHRLLQRILRHETDKGHLINFKKLLEFNIWKIPFY